MARRSALARLGWLLRDYAKRIWDNAGEDNVLFLAGGISFNLMLAAVPFLFLLLSGLGYLLRQNATQSSAEVWLFIERLLPPHDEAAGSAFHSLLNDVIANRGTVGLYGLIGFVWFSTRLFGSLRTVLAEVFDIEQDRGIVAGKIFDIEITVVATLLFVAYTGLTAYLNVATSHGVAALAALGLGRGLMGRVEYAIGATIASGFIIFMFFLLYKFLPSRRIRWQAALVAAIFTGVLFEVAKSLFTLYLTGFNPAGLYTGTLSVLVVAVVWIYYSSLVFILGGEVGRVYELRRMLRLQHEVFER